MFKVERPNNPPAGLKKGYDSDDVVKELRRIFHKKCYLCETKNPMSPEVEHFIPKSANPALERDWDNLFYSCRRCNSIKSNSVDTLLDCTKDDVFEALTLELPTRKKKPILVHVNSGYESVAATNTKTLLEKCYNREESGYQEITRAELRSKLVKRYLKYLKYSEKLLDDDSGKKERAKAEDKLERMLQPDYPYSCFWRRLFLEDDELMEEYAHLVTPTPPVLATA
ncbi:HNH endonuclease [Vibrio parahaemolyticus]|uniref:HNH endonuclease n=1 Tax=Vibrio parahaemolyticus TaxID=670 RepID=UPI003B66D4C2